MKSQGEMIATLRKRAGLTQSELAFECGWNKSRLSNYEQQSRAPKLDDLKLIAGSLDKHLGSHTIIELITGKKLSELAEDEGFVAESKFKIETAISVFKSFISDAVEFGQVKLRPTVTQKALIKTFSSACVQAVESSSESTQSKAH